MSQSGYTPIQLYRTTTASATPSAGNLSAGELAINLTDEKLFFKNASGTVKVLASTGAGNAGGSNTQVQYNSSGVLTGSSGLVFDGTNLGIGDSSFAYRLVVGGDVRIAGGGGDIRIQSATGTTTSGGDSVIYNDANDLIFGTGTTTTQRLRIDSSGNVIVAGGTMTVGGAPVAIGLQSTGQQVISSSTALTASGNAGSNILVVSSGITITLPTSAVTGKAITISNISGGNITLSYTGSNGTDGPTTLASGTSLMLISDGGTPPFWRMFLPFGAFDSTTMFESGYKDLPQNQQTSGYTLALADRGKHIFATASSFTITIPTNASVAFPIGSAITIFCGDATKTLAPASGVTLVQAGTSNTGSRTLGINALVTLVKLQTNTWVVSGAGLS